MNSYDLGTDIMLGTAPGQPFKRNGVATNPEIVTLTARKPDNTLLRYVYGVDEALVNPGTGAYNAIVLGDVAGEWAWRLKGSGTVNASARGTFFVTADDL
jgi:hypothetical protein